MLGVVFDDKQECDPTSVAVSGEQPGGRVVESGQWCGKPRLAPFHQSWHLLGHRVSGGVALESNWLQGF